MHAQDNGREEEEPEYAYEEQREERRVQEIQRLVRHLRIVLVCQRGRDVEHHDEQLQDEKGQKRSAPADGQVRPAEIEDDERQHDEGARHGEAVIPNLRHDGLLASYRAFVLTGIINVFSIR